METVIGYTRVSTKNQKDGISLEDQAIKIKMYCELKGFKLDKIYVDNGKSGGTISKRPEFKKALDHLSSDSVSGIVAYDLSRLSRRMLDLEILLEGIFKKKGLHTIKENVDTKTVGGMAMLRVLTAFNQMQREEASIKTREAFARKRLKGEYTGGKVPFGYKVVAVLENKKVLVELTCDPEQVIIKGDYIEGQNIPDNCDVREVTRERKMLVECEEELKLIKRAKNMRYKKVSFQKIADRFNACGIINKRSSKRTWTKYAIMGLIKK